MVVLGSALRLRHDRIAFLCRVVRSFEYSSRVAPVNERHGATGVKRHCDDIACGAAALAGGWPEGLEPTSLVESCAGHANLAQRRHSRSARRRLGEAGNAPANVVRG